MQNSERKKSRLDPRSMASVGLLLTDANDVTDHVDDADVINHVPDTEEIIRFP